MRNLSAKFHYYFLSIILLVAFSGCTNRYYAINPKELSFYEQPTNGGKVSFGYKYDVLRTAGNKNMSRKQTDENIEVVAVKITNSTDSVLNVENALSFYVEKSLVSLMSPHEIKNELKQGFPIIGYYFFPFLNPWSLLMEVAVQGELGVGPVPFSLCLIGGYYLGDLLVREIVSMKFQKELKTYDIRQQKIKPHESVVGLIGFYADQAGPISIKLNQ